MNLLQLYEFAIITWIHYLEFFLFICFLKYILYSYMYCMDFMNHETAKDKFPLPVLMDNKVLLRRQKSWKDSHEYYTQTVAKIKTTMLT